jgi:hypothetical protein
MGTGDLVSQVRHTTERQRRREQPLGQPCEDPGDCPVALVCRVISSAAAATVARLAVLRAEFETTEGAIVTLADTGAELLATTHRPLVAQELVLVLPEEWGRYVVA